MKERVRTFIREAFGEVDSAPSLMETGLVDSTGVLEIVAFVEGCGIAVSDEDITPENFDSVRAIASYIERRLHAL